MIKKIIAGFLFVCQMAYAEETKIIRESKNLYDKIRNRFIPVEIYKPIIQESLPIVIINHGYEIKNIEYSFIAEHLSKKGYFVASIQHDLEGDPKLPRMGDLFRKRKPIWEQGVQNILFVISEFKKKYANLTLDKIILIGHSNGGDISMLFAETHSELVKKVISLDSLRYPIPASNYILSLRANDTIADQGVIPETGAKIISIKDAKHIDMHDHGPEHVKQEIIDLVTNFLREDCEKISHH